jgi:hypothetical protein
VSQARKNGKKYVHLTLFPYEEADFVDTTDCVPDERGKQHQSIADYEGKKQTNEQIKVATEPKALMRPECQPVREVWVCNQDRTYEE